MNKFDVVIPVYNQSKQLICCLKSILNQGNFVNQIIVVDDGSDENIRESLLAMNLLESVKLIKIPHSGRAVARNVGVSNSIGENILFLDSDRILTANSLKALSLQVNNNKNTSNILIANLFDTFLSISEIKLLCYSSVDSILEQIEKRKRLYSYFSFVKRGFENNLCFLKKPWIATFSGSMCMRRSLFEDINGFDESFKGWGMENFELGYRLCSIYAINYYIVNDFSTIHLAHGRTNNFYETNIKNGIHTFFEKHKDESVVNLKLLLDGEITLGQFDFSDDERLNIYYHAPKF